MDFNIRSNALKIITQAYISCSHDLKFKDIDCETICSDVDKYEIAKAIRYLVNKAYIKIDMITTKISGELMVDGIDFVENCHNVSLNPQTSNSM